MSGRERFLASSFISWILFPVRKGIGAPEPPGFDSYAKRSGIAATIGIELLPRSHPSKTGVVVWG